MPSFAVAAEDTDICESPLQLLLYSCQTVVALLFPACFCVAPPPFSSSFLLYLAYRPFIVLFWWLYLAWVHPRRETRVALKRPRRVPDLHFPVRPDHISACQLVNNSSNPPSLDTASSFLSFDR